MEIVSEKLIVVAVESASDEVPGEVVPGEVEWCPVSGGMDGVWDSDSDLDEDEWSWILCGGRIIGGMNI